MPEWMLHRIYTDLRFAAEAGSLFDYHLKEDGTIEVIDYEDGERSHTIRIELMTGPND